MSEFAGLLRSRMELLERTDERLSTGISADSWEVIARFKAHLDADGIGKPVEGLSLSSPQRFRVLTRNVLPFKVDQRIRWAGRLLCIRQVLADPLRPERVTLRCEELRT